MPKNELYICILVKFDTLLFPFPFAIFLLLIMIPSVIDIFDVSIAFHHVTVSNNYIMLHICECISVCVFFPPAPQHHKPGITCHYYSSIIEP